MMFKIVHVEWVDSQTTEGWTPSQEVSGDLELTHSVGFLIKESSLFVTLAHSNDPQTDSFNGIITIPRDCVKRVKVLQKVKLKSSV